MCSAGMTSAVMDMVLAIHSQSHISDLKLIDVMTSMQLCRLLGSVAATGPLVLQVLRKPLPF